MATRFQYDHFLKELESPSKLSGRQLLKASLVCTLIALGVLWGMFS